MKSVNTGESSVRNGVSDSDDPEENYISGKVIEAAIKVHKNLGPGLLESAYEACLYYELQQLGLAVRRQVPMPLVYEAIQLDVGYRIDLIVEDKVVIEIKSVDAINDVHIAQVLTYLKLSKLRLGLLINFNDVQVVKGVKRLVNGL